MVSEGDAGAVVNGPVGSERVTDTPPLDESDDADASTEAGYVPMSEWLGDFDRR